MKRFNVQRPEGGGQASTRLKSYMMKGQRPSFITGRLIHRLVRNLRAMEGGRDQKASAHQKTKYQSRIAEDASSGHISRKIAD